MEHAEPVKRSIFCPKCGRSNVADARFCNHCGNKIPEDSAAASSRDEAPRDPLIGKIIEERFRVHKLIGEGGMGRVYLAEQTSMGRPVALKVLSWDFSGDERIKDRFRNEASLASRLNHPGTVIIYDFGVTADGLMFIAMELLEGKSLKDELDECGSMNWRRTASIARQICGSLQDAHDKAIIHRDLKPENIMLIERNLEKDVVKVLDFGVAKILIDNDWRAKRGITAPNEIFGTPEYMSPEQARGDDMSTATDIYSLGVILFRMLSGRLPFDAPTPIAVLAKHLGETPPRLASCVEADSPLPDDLESLVMQCLAKNAAHRPRSMDEVRTRLEAVSASPSFPQISSKSAPPGDHALQASDSTFYRQAEVAMREARSAPQSSLAAFPVSEVASADDSHSAEPSVVEHAASPMERGAEVQFDAGFEIEETSFADSPKSAKVQTLERLFDRIKSSRDFPAVSRNISELNTKVAMETTSASQLANVILKDTSLTTRLIKLANSPFYGNTRGRITMVSRAVVLMGFNAVREAALGLLLFDHLQSADPERASDLQDAAISALMAGVIAKENAWRIKGVNKEEAFICAMFHTLGRQAAIFYLPSKMAEIKELTDSGTPEDEAVLEVLGVSFDDLGQELARQWDFPEQIRNTMVSLPNVPLGRPKSKEDKLRYMAGFATELTKLASVGDPAKLKDLFAEFVSRYEDSVKISHGDLSFVVSDSLEKMEEYAKNMNLRPAESHLVQEIHRTMGTIRKASDEEPAPKLKMTKSGRIIRPPDMSDDEYAKVVREIEAEEVLRKEQILKEGIEEVTSSMKGHFDLNTVMLMVLESMYRALGLYRVFFCLYDVRTKTLRARFGFGKDVDELLPSFHFSPRGGRDVFTQAASSGENIVVMNTSDKKYLGQIPLWYKSLINAPMLMLYPIRIKQFSAAMFYGDMDAADPVFDPSLLVQMEMLHEKASAAIAMVDRSRR